jgi:hypothetical protein
VHYGYLFQHRPLRLGLIGHFAQLVQCHAIVRLILEAYDGPASAFVADRANERIYRASTIRLHELESGGHVDELIRKVDGNQGVKGMKVVRAYWATTNKSKASNSCRNGGFGAIASHRLPVESRQFHLAHGAVECLPRIRC